MGYRNPYDYCGTNGAPLVDATFGQAYYTVKFVADNMDSVTLVANNIQALATSEADVILAMLQGLPKAKLASLAQSILGSMPSLRSGDTQPTVVGTCYFNNSGFVVEAI